MRFLLLLLVSSLNCATAVTTVTVFERAKDILDIVQNVIDLSKHRPQEEVFGKLANLTFDINDLSNRFKNSDDDLGMMRRLVQNLGSTDSIGPSLNDIRSKQFFLNYYFKRMQETFADYEEYDKYILLSYANGVVSPSDNSVPKLMSFIRQTLTSKFLEEFSQEFRPGTAYFCKEEQSMSQVLQNFLNEVLILQTKSFVLIQGAYFVKRMYQKGNFGNEVEYYLLDFQESTNSLVRTFKPYIDTASLEVWKCDPKEHEEGTTFIQLKNFLHGFILNKANLDSTGSCSNECETYTYVQKIECSDNEWCKNQIKCSKIVNCRYVDSSMTVYPQSINQTNRRYHHIDFGNGLTYGKKNISSDGWPLKTYNEWFIRRCSYCFCLCDEGPKYFSDIYINMRLTTSNIRENKVVTGLRFVKHNGIIHLQIQEGKVLEKGKIDVDTLRWVPPHNYSRADKNVKEGKDYHTFSWNQRGFQLKDTIADDGYVITGVRVLKFRNQLFLELLTTRYDFATGKLGKSRFQEDRDFILKQKFSKELKLVNPDIPTRSSVSDVISEGVNVEFTHSDFEKDAGQTTVPFFDAQSVESAVPVPLSGIGVFHRGRKGYGGFIAPRIFTYNFTQHLTDFRTKL